MIYRRDILKMCILFLFIYSQEMVELTLKSGEVVTFSLPLESIERIKNDGKLYIF